LFKTKLKPPTTTATPRG